MRGEYSRPILLHIIAFGKALISSDASQRQSFPIRENYAILTKTTELDENDRLSMGRLVEKLLAPVRPVNSYVVLWSLVFASYDWFQNFSDRGAQFMDLVHRYNAETEAKRAVGTVACRKAAVIRLDVELTF
jgi:hypothetical protein